MTDAPNFATRRANATNEIRFVCKRILSRVEDGPTLRAPTSEADALRFEAIAAALETALTAAIAMSDSRPL